MTLNYMRRHFPLYIFSFCIAACILIWYAVYRVELSRNLVIHFFDIGQGDGIFFELPNHVQVLIDGGPTNAILAKLGNVMPFWDHTIDLVILTHPHADHVDGLIDVLKRYNVGMVIESGVIYATPDYDEWNRLLKEKRIPLVYAYRGQRIALSDISRLDILYPTKELAGARFTNIHDSMVIAKLLYGSTTVLLMGDAEAPVEYELMGSGIPLGADVLKIGHHGSKTSSTQGFLNAVHPRIAIIPVGRKNHYGHPRQEVLDRIFAAGISFFRTDINGDIEIMSDGKKMWKSN